jgi:hypothetical protein
VVVEVATVVVEMSFIASRRIKVCAVMLAAYNDVYDEPEDK